MSLDFLAKALAGTLFKVEVNNIHNLHIGRDFIQAGNKKITDPVEVKKIQDNVNEELKKHDYNASYPVNILHKDRKEEFDNLTELTIEKKESLKRFKDVFEDEEMKAIILARSIHLAIDKNKSKVFIESLLNQLEKDFPRDGKKILNLISAKYFDELIIPMIDICKEQYPLNYKQKFNEFFYSLLIFFPTAIFVNNDSSKEWIVQEINKRLKLRTIPWIKIHTIGNSNIKKITEALEEFESPTEFSIENNNFSTASGLSAQITILKIIKNRGI